jgi:glutamate 5-kinase
MWAKMWAQFHVSGGCYLSFIRETAVEGEFLSGDTVELISDKGVVIARGLVAFDSTEIPRMPGRSTKELAAELGAEYEHELVHRDDLVLI